MDSIIKQQQRSQDDLSQLVRTVEILQHELVSLNPHPQSRPLSLSRACFCPPLGQ